MRTLKKYCLWFATIVALAVAASVYAQTSHDRGSHGSSKSGQEHQTQETHSGSGNLGNIDLHAQSDLSQQARPTNSQSGSTQNNDWLSVGSVSVGPSKTETPGVSITVHNDKN